MSQSRIPSPARSQEALVTPRRLKTRGTRSVGSPARSTASGRLSSIIQFKDNNKESFFLSPLPARRSVLNDNTEIEEPRRRSWWKKLSENSRDVMEVLNDNKILETNEAVEEYIDIEVLSQEKKNYTFDLPESSDNESISSIVIPQRKLFTQKENQPQKKFAQLGGARETLAKLNQTVQQDKTVHVAPRNLFNQASKPKSKPLFPAALLNISSNKTVDKTKENAVAEVKGEIRTLFGNRPGTKRKNMFADFIVSESEDEISEIQPKVFGFQKRDEPHQGPSTAHNKRDASPSSSVTTDIEMEDWRLLPSSTMVENQLEDMMVKTPVKRARLSMLPNIVESDTMQTTNNSINKTRQSNKSTTKNKSKYFPEHIQDNENRSLKSLTKNRSKLLLEQAEAEKDLQEPMKEDLEVVNDGLQSEDKDGVEIDEIEEDMGQTSFSGIIQTPNVSHDTTGRRRKNDQSKVDPPKLVPLNKSKQINSSTVVEKQLEDMMTAVSTPAMQARGSKLPDIKESATIQNTNTSIDKTRQSNKSATKNKSITSPKDNEDNESQSHKSLTRSRSKLLLEQAEDENEHQKDNKEVEDESPEVASTGESEAANEVLQYEDDDSVQNDETNNESGQTSSNNQSGTLNVSHNITDQHRKKDQSKVNSPEAVLHDKTKQMESYTIVEKQMEVMMGDVNTPVNVARLSKLPNSNKSGTIHTSIINNSINKTRQSNKFSTKNNSLNSLDQIEINMNRSLTSLTRNRSKLLSEQIGTEEDQDVEEDGQEVEEEKQELNVDDQEEKEVSQEVDKKDQEVDEESNEVEEDGQESEDERQDVEDVEEEIQKEDEDDQEVEIRQEVKEGSQEMDEDDQEEVEVSQEVEKESQEVDEDDQEETEVSEEVEEESQEVDEDDQEVEEEGQEVNEESDEVEVNCQESEDENQEVDEQSQEMEDDKPEDESNEEIEADNEDEDSEQIGKASVQPSFNNENGTPNVSHDTTGRHRRKEQSKMNSPEVILHDKTKQMESFVAKGRNTSLRRTSIIKSMGIRPSLVPHRDSTGISDGTENSSAEGSGWDSHRTTRKTLRQTFGKDFSPRKSLRALVMEKSAKRQTAINDVASVTSKFPQANSTELPEGSIVQEYDEVVPESDHEVSKRTRQTTLEMYLQKIKKQNMEKKMQMEEIVRNSLKAPPKDTFKVPTRPMFAPRKSNTKAQSKPKAKQKSTLVLLDDLPADVLEDMKYKPPKRFQPSNAAWITKHLYKFLETKLEPKYDYKARLRAEKLVANIYQFCRELRRCEAASPAAVQALKVDMARLNVATTHFEFYQFFHDYMPREVRVKVVPDVVNKIPLPKHGVFSDILREHATHD